MMSDLCCRLQYGISRAISGSVAGGVALLCSMGSAHAANIIADGGFEAAGANNIYYAGQSIDGGSWNVTAGAVYIDSVDPYVYAGSNSLNLTYANPYVADTVSQVLVTTVGRSYTVTFFANADSANTFSVLENGLALSGAPTSIAENGFPGTTNSALFVNYLATFTATSASTMLSLSGIANPPIGSQDGSVMIDNVSVQPSTAVTPEPSSLVFMLTGALGIGATLRQRHSARSAAVKP